MAEVIAKHPKTKGRYTMFVNKVIQTCQQSPSKYWSKRPLQLVTFELFIRELNKALVHFFTFFTPFSILYQSCHLQGNAATDGTANQREFHHVSDWLWQHHAQSMVL